MSLFSVFLLAQSAAEIANSVSEIRTNNSERAAANAKAAAYSAQAVAQSKPQNTLSRYDIDLFYAKVAMLSYIAKSDNLISQEEKQEFNQTLTVAGNMYGYEAIARARQIFDNEGSSFTALEQYLRKVQERDLDAFLFYADEYTKIDRKLAPEEQSALQKLRSYIDTRKGRKSFQDLTCPSCGAALHPDSYGYKAVCGHCGYEVVLNTDNSPQRLKVYSKCTRCGTSFQQFKNSNNFVFCTYCGGKVINVTESASPNLYTNNTQSAYNEPNLYISYTSINPNVFLVTRIVSTGAKHTYVNGQSLPFRLTPGPQTIILKIGKKNYSRDIVISTNNTPVRIYASYNGRAQITIDQPPCYMPR